MTTFEITITILTVIGVLLMAVSMCFIIKLLELMKRWQESIWQELRSIRVNVADTAEYTHNHIAPDVESISSNFLYLLDESKGLPFKIDWDKLSKEQQDEFLKRLIMPNYDKPFQPIYTPCYAPDGICSNPFGDCINCPKRGTTGGTWSTNTSIKAEDAPLQERFNDNKED